MRRHVVSFITGDLVLGLVNRGVPSASFEFEIFGVLFCYFSRDSACFGSPGNVVSDFEVF